MKRSQIHPSSSKHQSIANRLSCNGCTEAEHGQAIVEFTFGLLLFLLIAWIPADFGLAFYTSQISQNASREGARIAASDPTLTIGTRSCTLGTGCNSEPADSVLLETSIRLPGALLSGGVVTSTLVGATALGACDSMVTVRVQGTYKFFFLGMLRYLGASVPNSLAIDRGTVMRWEHQPC